MATPQRLQSNHFDTPTIDLGNPAVLSNAAALATEHREIDRALRVASVLQTTLDIREVLEIFVRESSRWIAMAGARYCTPEQDTELSFGEEGKHAITYHLAITKQSLGKITFTRNKKFNKKENKALENLICGLVYPLRNALAYERALQAALTDPLTGVNNRAAMDVSVTREVELSRRHGTPLSLVAIDIDHFKKINDKYGHAAGDRVLKSVAQVITATVRSSDMVFRYGGEEFMILLSSTGEQGAVQLAERIRKNVQSTEIRCDDTFISATISVGIAWLEEKDSDQTLFQKADKSLYVAKSSGRNCVRYSAP